MERGDGFVRWVVDCTRDMCVEEYEYVYRLDSKTSCRKLPMYLHQSIMAGKLNKNTSLRIRFRTHARELQKRMKRRKKCGISQISQSKPPRR